MLLQSKTLLINKLIKRYENSAKFTNQDSTGRLSVKFSGNGFPEYCDDANYRFRKDINAAASELEKLSLIEIKWLQKGILIDRISFEVSCIPKLYDILGVGGKEKELANLANQITELLVSVKNEWLKNCLHDLLDEIKTHRRYPSGLPAEKDKLEILMKSLTGLDDNRGEDILERVFSKKHLGNSKLFEQHARRRVVSILRKYANLDSDMEDEDVLAEFGIEKSSSEMLLKGNIVIKLNDRLVDLSLFPHGVGLDNKTIEQCDISNLYVSKVVSIENKANYKDFIVKEADANTLVVFAGGFCSPKKRMFLKKIRDFAIQNNLPVEYFHWGDLDFGGFNIFKHLRKVVIPELKPLNMDCDVYLKNIDFGESFDNNYRKKLEKLLLDDGLKDLHSLIREILKQGKILEQEALLL